MSTIDEYLADLTDLTDNLHNLLAEAIKQKEGFIVGLIKNRLYQQGIKGDGTPILPDYHPATEKWKKQKNQRTSHVTLRDQGLFYAGLYAELVDWTLVTDSRDDKTLALKDKYGDSITDLTTEEQELIIDSILEPIVVRELNKLGNINLEI